MNRKNRYASTLAPLALCGTLVAGTGATHQAAAAKHASEPTPSLVLAEAPPEPTARAIAYGEKDVVSVRTKVRFTTLIILPKSEQILDFTCGDKEFWIVNGNQNFAYVKPAKIGAKTNLNLVTASGNVYSFALSEISESLKEQPDFKLFVDLKDDSMLTASRSAPKFVSAQDVQQYKDQADHARDEARQTKQAAQDTITKGIQQFVSNVRFPYHFEAGKKPFSVRAMYHDDRFTYIQARPEETPTLYEVKDGQPNLVNFTYKDGVYVVEKILDRGYLAIGKQKLSFTREE
jgi:type IV secretory pathway VirB9-like protein